MTRRLLTILVAIVLAVIGTGAVLLYVKHADQRALDGQKAVSTLVATQQIPAGTRASSALKDGMLTLEKLPAASVPSNAVRTLTRSLGALVFSSNLPSGQLLLQPMLVPSVSSASGLAIPPRDVAVTIALCVPQEVAGYVGAGSQVAIFDTVTTSKTAKTGNPCGSGNASGAGSGTGPTSVNSVFTRIVLPKVTVLAIGQPAASNSSGSGAFAQSSSSSSSSNGTVLVTLAVDQSDAERVITLAESGAPYLALLGPTSVTGPDHGYTNLLPPFK